MAAAWLSSLLLLPHAGADLVVVRPPDTGAALSNPGMGWVLHHYDNTITNYGSKLAPSDTVDAFPGLGVVYLRLPWSYLEPAEGQYTWSTLDTPAQRWIAKGHQVALRISCCESGLRYATPQWVQEAGAKGYDFRPREGVVEGGPLWEPDYDDPIFLAKLDRFLAALAARYDGNPEVAFIDVGSFGVWGEGHTFLSSKLPFSAATVRRHLALHQKHFTRTLLAVNDDFSAQGRGDEVVLETAAQGLALRDDSILVQGGDRAYYHAGFAQAFWPRTPVILESEHYGPSKERGFWQDGAKYLQAVEEYHASYASVHWWPHEFLAAERPLIDAINQRLGYRLQLLEASWPARVSLGEPLRFAHVWRNAGVAPCLPDGRVAFTLRDAAGGLAAVLVDPALALRDLPVGAPGAAESRRHELVANPPLFLKPGTYDVLVSVGTATGTPRLALPLAGDDGARRYRLGTITITGDYLVTAGDVRREGDQWALPLTWTAETAWPPTTAPFCHFDQADRIVFQGRRTGPLPALPTVGGTMETVLTFDLEDRRDQQYDVLVGLFLPERAGQPGERLRPTAGQPDGRVRVGTLRIDAAGVPTLVRD